MGLVLVCMQICMHRIAGSFLNFHVFHARDEVTKLQTFEFTKVELAKVWTRARKHALTMAPLLLFCDKGRRFPTPPGTLLS